VNQSIVICPTADAPDPRFEQCEMLSIKTCGRSFQQENRNDLVFEGLAREELVRNLRQVIEPSFFAYRAPETERQPAQVGRVPAMRFYFFFKEPLHAFGMFG
jgi:hypothetical protein